MPPRKRAGKKPVKARPKSKKRTKHGDLTVPVEDSPYTKQDGVERVLSTIDAKGEIPSDEAMEKMFPGITFSNGARFELNCALVFRLRLKRYTYSQIMKALRITQPAMQRIVSTLRQNFEDSVYNISLNEQIGQSMATYREIQGMAMRMAGDTGQKAASRVRAMLVAASCEDRVIRALLVAGAYKEAVIIPKQQKAGTGTPLNAMQEAMAKILQGDEAPLQIEGGQAHDTNVDDFSPARI